MKAILVLAFGIQDGVAEMCDEGDSKDVQLSNPVKLCRRKCELIDGEVKPTFDLWEKYCVATFSSRATWDDECYYYFSCLMGCEIFKEEGKVVELSLEKIESTLPEAMDKEHKCEGDQCKAFCVRWFLNTCREKQHEQYCVQGKATAFYKCNELDCSAASMVGPHGLLLLAIFLIQIDAAGFISCIKNSTWKFFTLLLITICVSCAGYVTYYMFGRAEEEDENVWSEYDKNLEKDGEEDDGTEEATGDPGGDGTNPDEEPGDGEDAEPKASTPEGNSYNRRLKMTNNTRMKELYGHGIRNLHFEFTIPKISI